MKSFDKFLTELEIYKPKKSETLGIPRREMPQVVSAHLDKLFAYLKDNGAKIKKTRLPANQLKAIQSEFDDKKIIDSMTRRVSGDSEKPLIASSDKYIIDGHHRWLGAWNRNKKESLLVWHVTNMDIHKLLDLVHSFPHTTYKSLKEDLFV